MAQIVGERVQPGQAIVDYEEKVLPDYQAEAGQTAYIFFHTVPFEGSVGLVNLLTPTSAVIMGGLALSKVGYDKYLRFVLPFVLYAFVVCCIFIAAAAAAG